MLSHMLFILYKLRCYIHLLEIVDQCFKYSFASLFLVSNVLLKIQEIYCVFAFPPSSRRMCPPHPEGARPFKAQHQSDSLFFPALDDLCSELRQYPTKHITASLHFQIDIGLILLFFAKRGSRIVFFFLFVLVSGVSCEHPPQSKPMKHHFSQMIIRKRHLHNNNQSCTLRGKLLHFNRSRQHKPHS